jgi:hypothetical protein
MTAPGGTTDERLALFIQTDADLSGIKKTRTEIQGTAADIKLTADHVKQALAATGGDFDKATKLLERWVATEEKAVIAQQKHAMEMGRAHAAALKEDQARQASLKTVERIPPALRGATNAVGILNQAAIMGTGSMAGLATAAGNVAFGFASVSDNARVAAGAAGLGALVTVVTNLAAAWAKANEEAKATPEALAHIQRISFTQGPGQLEALRAARDAAVAHAAEMAITPGNLLRNPGKDFSGSADALKRAQELTNQYEVLTKQVTNQQQQRRIAATEQAVADEVALKGLARQVEYQKLVNAKKWDTRQLALRQIEDERKAANESATQATRQVDEAGHVIPLTAEQNRLLKERISLNNQLARQRGEAAVAAFQDTLDQAHYGREQGSKDFTERFQGRLDQIEFERKKEIERTQDVLGATTTAEQKKRALYKETAAAAAANAKSIVDVLLASGSKQVKAVGYAADAVRRILIGAQAAHAAVEAAIEGGKAIGSAAAGDFRGAALHAAAALELGKAAALGAQESLGGGTSGSGGGGGGAASDNGTFQARDTSGGGQSVIILQTINPFSREVMGEVEYQLNRGRVLKRPLQIAPTTGLVTAGG